MSDTIKLKELYDSAGDTSYLCFHTTKRLTLDYRMARRLAKNERSYFLPFSFLEEGSKAELYYYTGDLLPLLDYLQYELSASRQSELIQQIVRAWSGCEQHGFVPSAIYTSVKWSYVDPHTRLIKFVYLPLNGLTVENLALHDFLLQLVENITPQDSEAAHHATALRDFLRQQEVFSLFKLRQFISPSANSDHLVPVAKNHRQWQHTKLSDEAQRDFVVELSQELKVPGLALQRVQDGTCWALVADTVELGRAPAHGLVVSASTSVGRTHAKLKNNGGELFVQDCSSKNGTLLNGIRLVANQPTRIRPGDLLRLGDEEFRLVQR